MKPHECSNLNNCSGGDYCANCSHGLWYGEVYAKGRRWAFEFSLYGGVWMIDQKGKPLEKQPAEDHPVWVEWEKWNEEREAE